MPSVLQHSPPQTRRDLLLLDTLLERALSGSATWIEEGGRALLEPTEASSSSPSGAAQAAQEMAVLLSDLHSRLSKEEALVAKSEARDVALAELKDALEEQSRVRDALLQQLEAATESYRATLWSKGIDGLSDRLYKDFWG